MQYGKPAPTRGTTGQAANTCNQVVSRAAIVAGPVGSRVICEQEADQAVCILLEKATQRMHNVRQWEKCDVSRFDEGTHQMHNVQSPWNTSCNVLTTLFMKDISQIFTVIYHYLSSECSDRLPRAYTSSDYTSQDSGTVVTQRTRGH